MDPVDGSAMCVRVNTPWRPVMCMTFNYALAKSQCEVAFSAVLHSSFYKKVLSSSDKAATAPASVLMLDNSTCPMMIIYEFANVGTTRHCLELVMFAVYL